MKQLQPTESKRFHRNWKRTHPGKTSIILVLQSVSYPANVGAFFRIADAAGVDRLILTSATPAPPLATITKIGRDKHKVVNWEYVQNTVDALEQIKQDGYSIYALEITDEAQPYHETPYPEKTCIVVGNEDHGISKEVLRLCDLSVFLPMYGKGLSMNVQVSAAILVYHILHAGR